MFFNNSLERRDVFLDERNMFNASPNSGLNLTHLQTTGHSIQPWICNQYTSRQYISVNPQYTPRQSVSSSKSVYRQYTCFQYTSVYNQYTINSTLQYLLSPPEGSQYTSVHHQYTCCQYTSVYCQHTLTVHSCIPSVHRQSVHISIKSVHNGQYTSVYPQYT